MKLILLFFILCFGTTLFGQVELEAQELAAPTSREIVGEYSFSINQNQYFVQLSTLDNEYIELDSQGNSIGFGELIMMDEGYALLPASNSSVLFQQKMKFILQTRTLTEIVGVVKLEDGSEFHITLNNL